ncbi:MAG: hypothetical protein K8R25_11515 [Methanosarcinales archaeon]|nr:hypothetical protein [Methanosarcinales archaeon]
MKYKLKEENNMKRMKNNIKFGISAMLAIMMLVSMVFVPVAGATNQNTENMLISDMLTYVDIEEVYQSVNTYISKHPKATEEQVNQYTLKQIRKSYAKSESNIGILTQSGESVDLTPEEEKLFEEDPWKGTKALFCGGLALVEMRRVFGEGGVDNHIDAFRHAYWNALMVKYIDYSWADRWATAHEEGSNGLSAEMDLWNNNEGRLIASNHPDDSDYELSGKVMNALNAGVLRKIENDELVPTP